MAKHNELGKIGEEVAAKFLERKGYGIIDRNYRKK
ncbi:MAG: YraN family protein, partial [Patescibacteria group bacterium]